MLLTRHICCVVSRGHHIFIHLAPQSLRDLLIWSMHRLFDTSLALKTWISVETLPAPKQSVLSVETYLTWDFDATFFFLKLWQKSALQWGTVRPGWGLQENVSHQMTFTMFSGSFCKRNTNNNSSLQTQSKNHYCTVGMYSIQAQVQCPFYENMFCVCKASSQYIYNK